VITVEAVTTGYGGFTAVDDVTFTAAPGRVTGFLGPNGADKSTTLRVLVGLSPPDTGAQLAVTTTIWLVVPLAVGVRNLLRSEVK